MHSCCWASPISNPPRDRRLRPPTARLPPLAVDPTPRSFSCYPCGMTPAGREWFRSLVIVALCFAFAAWLWTAGGAVFERPTFDEAAHSED